MNKYQLFAVGHYFSEWPEHLSFEEFMTALQNDADIIDCWPVVEYEGIPNPDMFYMVTSMIQCLKEMFPCA